MSYDIQELRIHIRLARRDPESKIDDEARDRLKQEIRDLIEANPNYRRIVTCGP